MSVWVNNNGIAERRDGGIALPIDSVLSNASENPVQNKVIKQALDGKQDTLTMSTVPTTNNNNPITSGGVKDYAPFKFGINLNNQYGYYKEGENTVTPFIDTIDNSPVNGSTNPVSSGGVYNALLNKQNNLTFDSNPTANSNNPVKSSGIYNMINGSFSSSGLTMLSSGQILHGGYRMIGEKIVFIQILFTLDHDSSVGLGIQAISGFPLPDGVLQDYHNVVYLFGAEYISFDGSYPIIATMDNSGMSVKSFDSQSKIHGGSYISVTGMYQSV